MASSSSLSALEVFSLPTLSMRCGTFLFCIFEFLSSFGVGFIVSSSFSSVELSSVSESPSHSAESHVVDFDPDRVAATLPSQAPTGAA